MAEVAHAGSNSSDGKVRVKKQSTRVDMTPMVDLAFLLLTFFILTAAFKKDRVLELVMPEKIENDRLVPLIPAKNTLNLALAANNKVYWWIGLGPPVEVTDFSKDGIRSVLLRETKRNPSLMVLIKPRRDSRYANVVDILDEMTIAGVKRYAIVKFTADDQTVFSGHLAATQAQ